MRDFLVTSVIASILLTVVLNLWLWYTARRRSEEPLGSLDQDPVFHQPPPLADDELDDGQIRGRNSSVRVYFPWKAMLAISIGLTIVLNVAGALGR